MARLLVPQTGNGGFDSPQGRQSGPYRVGYRNYNGHNVATSGDRVSERGRSLVDPGVCQRPERKQFPRCGRLRCESLARLPPSRGWRATLRTSSMEVRFLPVALILSRAFARASHPYVNSRLLGRLPGDGGANPSGWTATIHAAVDQLEGVTVLRKQAVSVRTRPAVPRLN